MTIVNNSELDVVWLEDWKVYGFVVSHSAYAALVKFESDGDTYEVWVDNDDLEYLEDHALEYERD